MADETPEQQLARILAGPLTPEMQKMVDEHKAKLTKMQKDSFKKMVKDTKARPGSKFK